MNFVDPDFIFLFICFIIPYYILKGKLKLAWLLICSYVFYAAFSKVYCLLLLTSSLVDYVLGLFLDERDSKKKLKKYVIVSIVFNLSLLAVFKYNAFFWNDIVIPVFGKMGVSLGEIQAELPPVGISFFTFQTMSYAIDIYRGHLRASKSILNFFVYVSMFPQLVAGPIVRAKSLLPQINILPRVDREHALCGLKRFFRGFIKKACIADSLALLIVDPAYADPGVQSSEFLCLAILAYSFQIYFDFSGYSDMAIGLGQVMGFRFPENFNYPYRSRSLSEFWTRWHISLSSWLRDYLYVPLGGNRLGGMRTYFNLLITMLLGGLWHGASFMFLLWGLLHGLALVIQRLLVFVLPSSIQKKSPDWLKGLICFVVVTLCWIPFRSKDWATMQIMFSALIEVDWLMWPKWLWNYTGDVVLLLGICFYTHYIHQALVSRLRFSFWPIELKSMVYASMLFWCLHYFPEDSAVQPFIYFQF